MATVNIEDMMLAHSTLYTGEPHGLNHINSVFGGYNRYKHLIDEQGSQQLYSALDAFEPMYAWRHGIIPEFKKDPSSYKIYKHYMLPLIPIIDEAQQKGALLNRQRLAEVKAIYQNRLDAISHEVRTLVQDPDFNIGGKNKLKTLLYGSIEIGDLQRDTLKALQHKYDPTSLEFKVIALRLEYSEKSKLLTGYVNNLVEMERIHPRHLPTQSSFRWSTIGPPLTNFPRECINPSCLDGEHEWEEPCWSLRDIVLPDHNEVLVTWDHDDAEGRVYALCLNDKEDLVAYQEGFDLHTITCCGLFDMALPTNLKNPHTSVEDTAWRSTYNWQGKDTLARVMAKGFKHGSKYSVSHLFVRSIKNVEQYGRTMKEMEQKAKEYLLLKKDTVEKKKEVMASIKRSKVARNLYGAKRQFYDGSEHTAKEGFSFMISSTVSLYNNMSLIMLKKQFPQCRLIHNCHDGDKIAFPKSDVPSLQELKSVIERPVYWDGREVMMTASINIKGQK